MAFGDIYNLDQNGTYQYNDKEPQDAEKRARIIAISRSINAGQPLSDADRKLAEQHYGVTNLARLGGTVTVEGEPTSGGAYWARRDPRTREWNPFTVQIPQAWQLPVEDRPIQYRPPATQPGSQVVERIVRNARGGQPDIGGAMATGTALSSNRIVPRPPAMPVTPALMSSRVNSEDMPLYNLYADDARQFFENYASSPMYLQRLQNYQTTPREFVDYNFIEKGPVTDIPQRQRDRITQTPLIREDPAFPNRGPHSAKTHVAVDPKDVRSIFSNTFDDSKLEASAPRASGAEVVGHEFAHDFYDKINPVTPLTVDDKGNPVYFGNLETAPSRVQDAIIDLQQTDRRNSHNASFRETRADVGAIRYLASKFGIYDAGTQVFTQDHLKNLQKALEQNNMQSFTLQRLLRLYGPVHLVQLMNLIAQNRQSNIPNNAV